MHLVESAAPSGSSHIFNELWEQKLKKQLQLRFATTLTLTLRCSDVIVVKSWH